MVKPTHKDGEMLIQLYTFSHTKEMMETFNWVMKLEKTTYDEFIKKNPIGSLEYSHFMRIAGFYELVGVLVKYETINEDIVLDMFALFWNKLGPLVKGMQKAMGSPSWFENYEYLAKRNEEWQKKRK